MLPPLAVGRRHVVLIAVSMLVLLPLGTTVAAAQPMGPATGSIVVEDDETVERVDGVAGTIVVRGTVTGDLSGVAGSIRIAETGQVGGDVDASAGSVVIAGTVDGNVQLGAGSIDITENGHIRGDLDAGAGYIRVDGAVDGSVRAAGGSVALGSNADIGGEFRYDADEFTQHPDATVDGGVVQDASLGGDRGGDAGDSLLPSWFGTVYSLVASLLFGAILLVAFPNFSSAIGTRVIEDPIRSGGIGLLSLILVPIALVLLAITIVGLPLAVVGIGFFVLGIWAAIVYGKYAVGRWVIGLADQDNRWLALVVGLVGFAVLGLIPFLGGLLEFLVLLVGLGALFSGLRELYRSGDTTGTATPQ
jgi:cytoskeletal protein CcmA (bactofilin family)